jgi:hypothetical protein
LLNAGYDASGRGGKVEERMRWAGLIQAHPLVVVNSQLTDSFKEVFDNYKAVDASIKGDKKVINHTAILLRNIMNGSIVGAKIWIEAFYRENKALPYVAPGIDKLLEINRFDKTTGEFAPYAGADFRLVQRVVRRDGFPKHTRLLVTDKDGKRIEIRGMRVFELLTAYNL